MPIYFLYTVQIKFSRKNVQQKSRENRFNTVFCYAVCTGHGYVCYVRLLVASCICVL